MLMAGDTYCQQTATAITSRRNRQPANAEDEVAAPVSRP